MRECVCVCGCVCEKERERERTRKQWAEQTAVHSDTHIHINAHARPHINDKNRRWGHSVAPLCRRRLSSSSGEARSCDPSPLSIARSFAGSLVCSLVCSLRTQTNTQNTRISISLSSRRRRRRRRRRRQHPGRTEAGDGGWTGSGCGVRWRGGSWQVARMLVAGAAPARWENEGARHREPRRLAGLVLYR